MDIPWPSTSEAVFGRRYGGRRLPASAPDRRAILSPPPGLFSFCSHMRKNAKLAASSFGTSQQTDLIEHRCRDAGDKWALVERDRGSTLSRSRCCIYHRVRPSVPHNSVIPSVSMLSAAVNIPILRREVGQDGVRLLGDSYGVQLSCCKIVQLRGKLRYWFPIASFAHSTLGLCSR